MVCTGLTVMEVMKGGYILDILKSTNLLMELDTEFERKREIQDSRTSGQNIVYHWYPLLIRDKFSNLVAGLGRWGKFKRSTLDMLSFRLC